MPDNIKLSLTLPVIPKRIYEAWLSSDEHSAFTGTKSKIERKVGSKFSCGDGYIEGEILKMVLFKNITQTWRTSDFPPESEDSILEVNLEDLKGSTKMVLVHKNLPEGDGRKYRKGWKEHYFEPMKNYFK